MSWKHAAAKGAIVSLIVLLATSTTAMASTVPVADVGTNLKGWLSGLGQDVFLPLVGLFGIAALFRRDLGHALVIALIAIVVGIFIYDATAAKSIIVSVANQLTK